MTATLQTPSHSSAHRESAPQPSGTSFWRGRSELILVAILGIIGAGLVIGSFTMNVLSHSKPGPQFTPMLIGVGILIVTVLLAIEVFRHREVESPHATDNEKFYDMSIDMLHDLAGMATYEDSLLHAEILDKKTWKAKLIGAPETEPAGRPLVHSDWRTLAPVLAACFLFIVILKFVGWVLSAALLFWAIAHFLGSKRPVFDIWIALIASSVIQLIFGGLMGLNLPAGFFGGF